MFMGPALEFKMRPGDVNMNVDISIVSPVFNEQENLLSLFNGIKKNIPAQYAWEFILVDDGSTDSSREIIRQLCFDNDNVKAVFLSKNFGHQIALSAGLDHAKGRAVITLDSDLQHPPESIPQMLRVWEGGAQIILGVREDSANLSWLKKATSWGFYALLKIITHLDLIEGAADFRLLDRKVVECLRQYRERDRFLRGIISDMGFHREVIFYKENVRSGGVVKYNLFKMIRLAITGVVSFSSFPLRVCSAIGIVISFLSLLYAAAIVYDKIVNGAPTGIASILVGVFFIGGVQLFFIGILGEYLMTIFKEVKARPLYNVAEVIKIN